MMRMNTQQASGWASALRVNLTSMTHFKSRIQPCRIGVRAGMEKCEQFTKNRPRSSDICTSSGDQQSRLPSRRDMTQRFTDHCRLKTDDSPPRGIIAFPIWNVPLQHHRAS